MRLKMMGKRIIAMLMAILLLMTMLPMGVLAESETEIPPVSSELPDVPTEESPMPDTTITEEDLTNESETVPVEPLPEETPAEGTEQPVEDKETGSSVEGTDESDASKEPSGEAVSDPTVTDPADDSATEADQVVDSTPAPVDQLQAPSLRSAANPSRFTGDEAVRLGKEGNNIYGIIVQKDGSSSTSITRHWVTVDGVKYTAYCIEASDASTSGRDGGLEPGTDAGLLWILNNVPEDSDEDYAIKQQAIWAYLGQSFTIRNLAAGSRCSLSTDQLRERLTDIVTNAQNASLTGSQELWIAYHLDNRSYYQDMAFTVAEPPPSITPTPIPTPTPTPTPAPITGSIRVMKSDASTGSALAGAVFRLLDAAFAPVGSPITTDASGIAEWMNLPAGDYYVQEIQAPEGYQVDDALYSASIAENNQLLTIEMTNEVIVGKIRITKVDADTQDILSGAIFTVTDVSGAIVATLTTDADGSAETDWLPYGSYTVTEEQAPDGYVNSGFTTVIEATENGKTYTLHVENTAMQGGIRLTKTDASNGRAIANVQFDIFDANGTLVGTMTTNADGVAVSGNLPRGQYTVREHELPAGYAGDLVELTAEVEPDSVTELTATNTPSTSKIRIVKIDAATKAPLAGAVFSVSDSSGSSVATLTTGEDGTAETDWLPYGTYTVTETAAPDRYINSGFSTTINAYENGQTYTVEVENEAMTGGLIIRKKDAVTGFAISGVQFDIYQGDTLIATMTTDANGVATCNGLDAGTYTVKEHALPTGYVGELVVLEGTVTSDVTTVLDATNMPSQSKIRIIKTDSVTGEMLPGAEFSIANAAGTVIGQLVTGEDGTTTSGWLPYGIYTITETLAPDSYINRGFSTRIKAYENGKTYTITVENDPTKGGIKVIKTDALTQQPIAGVQFDVYQADVLIGTMTTNPLGVAIIEDLEKGTYTVKEHALPTGYVGELAEMTAVVVSDQITELSATNTPSRSKVRIIKTDALTGAALASAEFVITDAAGNVVEVLTTDADGMAESDWLTYGTYTVTESAAPEHYVNSGFSQTFDAYEDGKTYEFSVTNAPTEGGIRLTKTDALTGKPIAGVKFNVYAGSALVGSMTTDANGVATLNGLEPGSYIVKGDALPTGYAGELVVLEATVVSDVTCELQATNTPSTSKIRIVKTDAMNGAALAGAEFTITDNVGVVVATITTDEDGVAITGWLPYGTYTVAETKAPAHYVNSGFAATVDAHEDGKTYEFAVSNAPNKGGIRLAKTDGETGAFLAGVKFNIYQGDTLIATMTTDENGVASCENLDRGTYLVKEDALPEGYSGELVVLEATVHSDTVTELHAVNSKSKSQIRIVKTDDLTGEVVSGAEFTVTDETGNVAAVITTDATGEAVTDWLPYGIYTVTETRTPEHYVTSDWSETVAAYENGVTYTFEVSNTPIKGYLQITKTDVLDDTLIEGVQFDIYRTGELIATMTTDANGVATSEALHKGTYTVTEHGMPEGYIGELATMEAVVKSDETTQLTASNQPIMGQIRIEKSDALTGEMLAGAEFTITRSNGLPSHNGSNDGEVVAVMTTDADGVAVSPLLTWGTYTVVETKIPEHYENQPFEAVVTISEHEKTYTIEAVNEPTMGYIRVVKSNSLDQMPIAGVIFDISQNSQIIGSIVTDADGVAVSDPLASSLHYVHYSVRRPS